MDRFTWGIVIGVLALVAAGVVVAAVVRGRDAPPDLNTPAGVVLAYALAEQRGDPQTAWDLLATSAKARGDRDRFLARAGDHGGGPSPYLTVEEERIDGDTASVVLLQTYAGSSGIFGAGSYPNRNTVRLAREALGWRITVPPDDYVLISTKP
jgi:hypothetical protein